MEELRKRSPKMDLTRYVKAQIIEKIYKEMNLPPPKLNSAQELDETSADDYVPETQGLRRKLNLDANSKNGIANGTD